MTWTLVRTCNQSTNNERWYDIETNVLATLPGWTVQDHPSYPGDNRYRWFQYTFTDTKASESVTHNFHRSGTTIYFCHNHLGDPVTQPDFSSTSHSTTCYSTITNDWKVWTSDQNDRAVLITMGKRTIGWSPGISEFWCHEGVPGTWEVGEKYPKSWFIPYPNQYGAARFGGPPTYTVSSTSEGYLALGWRDYSSTSSPALDEVYTTHAFRGSGDTVNNYGYMATHTVITQADVGMHMPKETSSNSDPWTTSEGLLLLSNGRYWLRSRGNLSYNSWMFDLGDTEPDLV